MAILFITSQARSETFDATRDYACEQPWNGVWYLEGYRASDSAYLSTIYGHASEVKEVSKYGVDAYYLPDGGQAEYPFATKLGDSLVGSPATKGQRFDAVLTWVAPYQCDIVVTGFTRLMGNIKGKAEGRKVKVFVVQDASQLWSGELSGGESREFELKGSVKAGARLRLHLQNAGDENGNVTAFNMRVDAIKK